MAEMKQELREVKEELATLEQELSTLLERQQTLVEKKQRLEEAIRDEASLATTSGSQSHDWEKSDFPWSKELKETRESVFKIKEFRPLQLQTMKATLSGKDCILIMPTGGGKSLCFQLPALVSKGITLVVSPLVSLMEDQLMALHELGIHATLLNASSTREEVKAVHDAMTNHKASLKLLYVTPEKLAKSKRFMAKVEKMFDMGRFSRLVIDEVHCCSQWGHDFRPDYKFLGIMRKQFPGVPILGLTATATSNVVQDVKKILGIQHCLMFRASFNRHNLFYEVRQKPGSLKAAMDDVQKLIQDSFEGESGIVYCLTQKDSEQVARELNSRGIRAGCYHASLDSKYRSSIHQKWTRNEIQVVVATVAFGMGIDKGNVRFVIHHSISKSMENYYQESGRAGRDDLPARCILYAGFSDVFRQSTMMLTETMGLENLYSMVTYAYNLSKCRRSLIARHFGERWDSTQCNEMCDHCDPSTGSVATKDITAHCKDLIALLTHARSVDQHVTPLKLLDAWFGKGDIGLRVSTVKPPKLSRQQCERVIVHLVLKEYLKEDFHFTPYSTISYLVPGPKAKQLNISSHTVEMELDFTSASASGKKSTSALSRTKSLPASSAKSAKSSPARSKSDHPKLVVVNHEKSKVVSSAMPVTKSEGNQSGKKSGKLGKTGQRKRKPVIDSDSDLESSMLEADFDFGDLEDREVASRLIKRSRSSAQTGVNGKVASCIVIDDSDNGSDDDFLENSHVKKVKESKATATQKEHAHLDDSRTEDCLKENR